MHNTTAGQQPGHALRSVAARDLCGAATMFLSCNRKRQLQLLAICSSPPLRRISQLVLSSIALLLTFLPPPAAAGTDVWDASAFKCVAPDGFAFPSKPQTDSGSPTLCDDGDMTLFNGLLCYSGNQLACEAVRRSQTPDGRFWRSPLRAQTGNLHYEGGTAYLDDTGNDKSFSPDMELGVLLYAIRTRDTSALSRWYNWISASRGRTCHVRGYICNPLDLACVSSLGLTYSDWIGNLGNVCLLQTRDLPRYCTHVNCTVQPVHRDVDDVVYSSLFGGAQPPDGIGNYYHYLDPIVTVAQLAAPLADVVEGFKHALCVNRVIGGAACEDQLPPELRGKSYQEIVDFIVKYKTWPVGEKIRWEAEHGASGFPRHLVAIRAWIVKDLNHQDKQLAEEAIRLIAEKEPNNAFYQYLKEGATPRVKDLARRICPTSRQYITTAVRNEWIWEQGPGDHLSIDWTFPYTNFERNPTPDPGTGKIAQNSSMVWDCVMMRNLLGDPTLGVDYSAGIAAILSLLLEGDAPVEDLSTQDAP
jgi:hypothetical protein